MADQWERAIPCEDTAGRERVFKVFPSENNRAVVQAPPGESGVLDAKQFAALRHAMEELTIELHRRAADS